MDFTGNTVFVFNRSGQITERCNQFIERRMSDSKAKKKKKDICGLNLRKKNE